MPYKNEIDFLTRHLNCAVFIWQQTAILSIKMTLAQKTINFNDALKAIRTMKMAQNYALRGNFRRFQSSLNTLSQINFQLNEKKLGEA